MRTAVIQYRVADFLRRFAPFNALPEPDLLDLARSGRVKFHESEEFLFRQGDAFAASVWVIQQGRVELIDQQQHSEQLRDVLGEGDLLGLDCFSGGTTYAYSARTATDVIVYSLDAALLKLLSGQRPSLKLYLEAHFSLFDEGSTDRNSWLDKRPPALDYLRARLAVVESGSAPQAIASSLADAGASVAAVVNHAGQPVALITLEQLCASIGNPSGLESLPPPPTIPAGFSTRRALHEMLRTRSPALAITADGKPGSALSAIVTASDLALYCGHNPLGLIREIRNTKSVPELLPLLALSSEMIGTALCHPADLTDCARLGTEVVTAIEEAGTRIARRTVSEAGLREPLVASCCMAFGNLARGEMVHPAGARVAVVYDDSDASTPSGAAGYFTSVAGETSALLETCGLGEHRSDWPEGAHPCMPLSEWKRFYRETIRDPIGHQLFHRREFFDIRLLFGTPTLLDDLTSLIAEELSGASGVIALLANDTLSHLPPLTFFRGIVLELDGEQRNRLDLVEKALNPVSDAARVFALARRRVAPTGTLDRLDAAAVDFPIHAKVFRQAAEAFRIALFHVTRSRSASVEPSKLSKMDQRLLKTAFASILRLVEETASTLVTLA